MVLRLLTFSFLFHVQSAFSGPFNRLPLHDTTLIHLLHLVQQLASIDINTPLINVLTASTNNLLTTVLTRKIPPSLCFPWRLADSPQQGMSACTQRLFMDIQKTQKIFIEVSRCNFLGYWIWRLEAWYRWQRYPRIKEEGHYCAALCAVTVGIAGRSERTRGCEDSWKTSCITHFGSGCQY
jgi:hypothetical protein